MNAPVVRFANFELDLGSRELRREGQRVNLREQPVEVLALLVERAGQVVTREELRKRLWGDDVFVDFDNGLNTAIARLREALGDPGLIETLPKKGYRFLGIMAAPRVRIAVLPFANLSGDPTQEYFCDGLTDEMIGHLAALAPERLSVIARTTSMHYKGTRAPVSTIAAELGLDYVLEGSVRREGRAVRVSAQLIEAGGQSHVWAKAYDATLERVLELQSELSRAIAEQIRIAVPGLTAVREAVDPVAYDLYLKGLGHMSHYNPAGLRAASACFRDAIRQAPGNAAVHAKLALAEAFSGYFGYAPFAEAYREAECAAGRAMSLDADLADAHFAMAIVDWFGHWDLAACERDLDRALRLNPSNSLARMGRAVYLATVPEDHRAAWAEMAQARALDPRFLLIRVNEGWMLYWSRRFEEAIAHAQETIGMDETCVQAYGMAGLASIGAGRVREAIGFLEPAAARFGDPLSVAWLGMAYGLDGQHAKARELLQRIGDAPPVCPAWVHIGLGENDRALGWIEKALDARDTILLVLRVSPSFDALRGEARYWRVVERLRLPACAFGAVGRRLK